MKRKIGVLSLVLFLFILGLAILFFFFQRDILDIKNDTLDTEGRNKLEENIIASLKNNPNQLDFTKVTNFKWDKVYVFQPYTPDDEITEQFGFKWKYSNETSINYADDINLLVFVKDDRVVQYLELSREYGDFIITENNKKTPTDSVIDLKPIK